jgi:hypothetical protein
VNKYAEFEEELTDSIDDYQELYIIFDCVFSCLVEFTDWEPYVNVENQKIIKEGYW